MTIHLPGIARVGPLSPTHRERVEEITSATGVFSSAEIAVAVELFDEAMKPATGHREALAAPAPVTGGQPGLGTGSHVATGYRLPVTGSRSPDANTTPPPEYIFLGAFTPDDELVGYACYGATPGTDRVFDLYWIAVDPGAQGAGGGTTLLSEVERRLHDVNARMLVVETSSRSGYEATRRFYERRDYHEAARLRDFYGPSDDRVIYLKRFHARPGSGAGSEAR